LKLHALIAHLRAHGCVLVREGAKHSWWGNPASGRRSAVPRHREINDFLAKKICNDLGIPTP
jgi:mRNA interferase HicA